MESDVITWTIANVFKQLDVDFVAIPFTRGWKIWALDMNTSIMTC
jgi:hypothetical protein